MGERYDTYNTMYDSSTGTTYANSYNNRWQGQLDPFDRIVKSCVQSLVCNHFRFEFILELISQIRASRLLDLYCDPISYSELSRSISYNMFSMRSATSSDYSTHMIADSFSIHGISVKLHLKTNLQGGIYAQPDTDMRRSVRIRTVNSFL